MLVPFLICCKFERIMPTTSLLVQINATACFAIGWPVNLLLIWLIVYRTNQQLLVWSRVLLQSAILDMGLSLITFLNQIELVWAQYFIFNAHFLYITENGILYGKLNGSIRNFDLSVKQTTVYLYIFWHEFSRHAMAVQFGYRWLVICREKAVSNKFYFLMLLIPFTIILMEFLVMYLDRIENCQNCEANGEYVYTMSYGTPTMFMSAGAFLTSATITVNSIAYFTIACWLKTRNGLMEQNAMSRKINRQVSIVLIAQAVYPIGLAVIPVIILVIFGILGMPIPLWLSLLVTQVWNTVVYPMIAILVIGHYRRILVKMFGFRGGSNASTNITQLVRHANVGNQVESGGRPIVAS